MSNPDYSKGYAAGRKYHEKTIAHLNKLLLESELQKDEERRERIYFRALGVALEHCKGWQIGGKKVKGLEDYSRLAEILAQQATQNIPRVEL